jgi:hypothetical protein
MRGLLYGIYTARAGDGCGKNVSVVGQGRGIKVSKFRNGSLKTVRGRIRQGLELQLYILHGSSGLLSWGHI